MDCIDKSIRRESLRKLGCLPDHGWNLFVQSSNRYSKLLEADSKLFKAQRIEDTVLSICEVTLENKASENALTLFQQLRFYLLNYLFLEDTSEYKSVLCSLDESVYPNLLPLTANICPCILKALLALVRQHRDLSSDIVKFLNSIFLALTRILNTPHSSNNNPTHTKTTIFEKVFYASHLGFFFEEIADACISALPQDACLWAMEVCNTILVSDLPCKLIDLHNDSFLHHSNYYAGFGLSYYLYLSSMKAYINSSGCLWYEDATSFWDIVKHRPSSPEEKPFLTQFQSILNLSDKFLSKTGTLRLQEKLGTSCNLFFVLVLKLALLSSSYIGFVPYTYSDWINVLLGSISEDPELLPHLIELMASLACVFPAHFQFAMKRLRLIAIYAPRFDDGNVTYAQLASRKLAQLFNYSSRDTAITSIYQFANLLSPADTPDSYLAAPKERLSISDNMSSSSSQTATVNTISNYLNVIDSVREIALTVNDEKIYGLAISLLIQKFSRKFDSRVSTELVRTLADISTKANDRDFSILVQFYSIQNKMLVKNGDEALTIAICDSRCLIARGTEPNSFKRSDLLKSLLEEIIHIGIVRDTPAPELKGYYFGISKAVQALVECVAGTDWSSLPKEEMYPALFRDMWFTLVINRFRYSVDLGETLEVDLENIAKNSPLLVFEDFGSNFESNLELNTVLRTHIEHSVISQIKSELLVRVPNIDLKPLSTSEICFLSAVLLLESLRCKSNKLSALVEYLLDPSLRDSQLPQSIRAIALYNLTSFVESLSKERRVASSTIDEFQKLLCLCCNRVDCVRQLALECMNYIMETLPHLLGIKEILFSVLELSSLLWKARTEECTDQYVPQLLYKSNKLNLSVILSDIYSCREEVLFQFNRHARSWIQNSSKAIPYQVKNLLESYLADFVDFDDLEVVELGRSLAVELGTRIVSSDRDNFVLPAFGNWTPDTSSEFMAEYTIRQRYSHVDNSILNIEGDMSTDRIDLILNEKSKLFDTHLAALKSLEDDILQGNTVSPQRLRNEVRKAAAHAVQEPIFQFSVLARKIVRIPFLDFSPSSFKLGITLWNWMMNQVPSFSSFLISNIIRNWKNEIVNEKRGYFSTAKSKSPLALPMTYSPTERASFLSYKNKVMSQMIPHLLLLQLIAGNFEGFWYGDRQTAKLIVHFMKFVLKKITSMEVNLNVLTRELHFKFVSFGLRIAENLLNSPLGSRFYNLCVDAGLCWFSGMPNWTYGADKLHVAAEISVMRSLRDKLDSFLLRYPLKVSTTLKQKLLIILLNNEMYMLYTWLTPVLHGRNVRMVEPIPDSDAASSPITLEMLQVAWNVSPNIVLYAPKRFQNAPLKQMALNFVIANPFTSVKHEVALEYLFEHYPSGEFPIDRKFILYWEPMYPVSGPVMFMPNVKWNPQLLQYTMRSMESYPVSVTFFYVPQIVQSLRYDSMGYAESFILETSGTSQLFAHQILWNMKANLYKDEAATIPDSIKPILDRVMDKMINSLSGEDKQFYEREFTFFNEVTSISGKLKPFIRKSKPEKKAKIDEEMKKIKLDVGVYLPSNPDGVIVGIDRKSGKPLQSHAKAPFMATFKIRKEKLVDADPEELAVNGTEEEAGDSAKKQTYEVWQSAIFKVGDDCRQDVLTLQLIAMFKNIFNSVGLDVYLFPYRVTATNPGCGVIDVLPNCISRDMLGREAVNGLYDYFRTKFGDEDSIAFQKARSNFVQSMAAYSVITYLLQFKDRHNGNIMIDDQGHILHIDFGFIFDIAPGGITFESAPFKLTTEMIAVMGGSNKSQPFQWFQELCVKAFLACRPYAHYICQAVEVMLDSGLPCFKGQLTITHCLERFALNLNERQASTFMLHLIEQSYANKRTLMYDQFQKATNGIPY